MSDWFVEQLRLTVFPTQDLREPDPNWWTKVVGQSPDTKTIQKGAALREGGAIRDGYCNLSLEIQISRIDWLMTPIIKADAPVSGFPVFDRVGGALKVFRDLLEPWLKVPPAMRRLALGTVLVSPVENKVDGYKKIARFLPAVKLDPENSTDFTYSINRPRRSSNLRELTINRLCRWSVAQLKGIQVQIEAPGTRMAVVDTGGDWSALRAELDVNTAAERNDVIPSDRILAIFVELLAFVEEISEKGDIP